MPDVIRVSDLEVTCIVGVHPRERHVPQPVLASVELELDLEGAGRDERVAATVDYGQLTAELAFLLQAGRFHLLETAARVLARAILLPPTPEERRGRVQRAVVRLAKPHALGAGALPEVEIIREAAWARLPRERRAFGTVEVLHDGRDGRVERLRFTPGLALTEVPPRGARHGHFVRGGRVIVDGVALGPGAVPGMMAARRWHNPGTGAVSLLRVEKVGGEPGQVRGCS